MYDYTTMDLTNSSDYATDALSGALAGIGIGTWIVSIALCVLEIVSMWKIFTKAGKPGWAAIVPIYNIVVLFQIAGMNPWLILLYLVPVANIIVTIMVYVNLAKAFGKGAGYAVGLLFLNSIFIPILAFSSAEYQGVE